MDNYKKIAIELAYEAGAIIKENFSLGPERELKDKDTSPVTIFDKSINKSTIAAIHSAFPDHMH